MIIKEIRLEQISASNDHGSKSCVETVLSPFDPNYNVLPYLNMPQKLMIDYALSFILGIIPESSPEMDFKAASFQMLPQHKLIELVMGEDHLDVNYDGGQPQSTLRHISKHVHMDLGPVELAMKKPRALSLPSSQQGGEAALPVTMFKFPVYEYVTCVTFWGQHYGVDQGQSESVAVL
ncbi:hypothetical protein Tco_0032512 [Tanacetum coccineum]